MNRVDRLSLALAFGFAVGALAAVTSFAFTDQGSKTQDPAVSQLRDFGKRLASAVLNHDIDAILEADRADLRADDRLALRDAKSDLYCFLFDTSCATVNASVYDILSRARRLDIDVRVFRERGKPLYGWLLFFDATKIQKSKLRSASFLCQHVGEIASWMFVEMDGQWISAHPPFDAETDTLCSPQ